MQQYAGDLVLSGPTIDGTHGLDTGGLGRDFVVTPAWTDRAHGDGADRLAKPGFRRPAATEVMARHGGLSRPLRQRARTNVAG